MLSKSAFVLCGIFKWFAFLVILHSVQCPLYSFEPDLKKSSLTTSVIIPCHYKHAPYLSNLLKCYSEQSIIPDEVVISLSEFDKVPGALLDAINNEKWPFKLTIKLSKRQLFAGQNRNIACKNASGDIFVLNDADDLPHPQRIETIRYFFENYHVNHLMHLWVSSEDGIRTLDIEKIGYLFPNHYQDSQKIPAITNGAIAISKRVFRTTKWTDDPKGEDVKFNQKVYKKFAGRIVLKTPLIVYRRELSIFGD